MKYVGVDIGGTNLKAGLVDESGNLLYAQELTLPVVSENTADAPEATQQPDLPSDAAGGEQGDGEPLQP